MEDERGDLRVKFPRRGNFMYPAEVTFRPSGLTYARSLAGSAEGSHLSVYWFKLWRLDSW